MIRPCFHKGVRFIRPIQKNNRRLYEFEVLDGVVPPHAQLHLRKVDETGCSAERNRPLHPESWARRKCPAPAD